MAAYAALLSLFHTLNHIKIHPRPPISLHQSQVDSLTKNLTFFQDFLERYTSEDDDEMESHIAAAAYAAEDVIETYIVDQIDHARSTSDYGVGLYGSLEIVIKEMDLIKKKVMEIIQEKTMRALQHHHLHTSSSVSTGSTLQSSTTPMFDEAIIIQLLDKLFGQQSSQQIVPIVGMGGIGKTTLAQHIYKSQNIVHHFDTLAWVTISQEYSVADILRQILFQGKKESEMNDNELGERVHKKLWGRRYLIVMDDMWSVEAFDGVRCFFPDNNNGSRIMITTRLSNLAFELSGSHVFRMKFLDKGQSWRLFCKTVFGNELGCPVELENIGREVARNCRGLPLSIVVIGGLLKNSNGTRAHWEYSLQNMSSLINLEDGEFCLRILQTSYKELPMHLKPCFLYMGIFREDYEIRIKRLIELWVAEGILRPTKEKILEEVGEECINELIDRNLILVHKLRWNGKAKVCKIHDLLRDVCLREAQKQKFLYVLKQQWDLNIPQCLNMERRICIHHNTKETNFSALESASLTRSLVSTIGWPGLVGSFSSRLLRVYMGDYDFHSGVASVETIFKKANLRFLTIVLRLPHFFRSRFPSSMSHLWNLQTLKVVIPSSWGIIMAPSDIWEMPLLRHVIITSLELPDPIDGENDLILEYLQTLCVSNLKCSRAVIRRIPNIMTLKIRYGKSEHNHDLGLNNIGQLTNLQSLHLTLQSNLGQNLCFPDSLKKLTLHSTKLNWDECGTMIGSLPLLQYLRLGRDALSGSEWETVEGGFCSLKVLKLHCHTLRHWRTQDTHFPCLELLDLQYLEELEEIPSSIGDIPTLNSICLNGCSKSAEDSAKGIKEEQLELGNMDLQIYITEKTILSTWRYHDEVKETLRYQPEKYYRFFDVMSDNYGNRMDIDGVIREVKVLFKGYPSLIRGFNSLYVPEGYDKVTLSDVEEDASLLSWWSSWFYRHLVPTLGACTNSCLFIFIIMFLAACAKFFLY